MPTTHMLQFQIPNVQGEGRWAIFVIAGRTLPGFGGVSFKFYFLQKSLYGMLHRHTSKVMVVIAVLMFYGKVV